MKNGCYRMVILRARLTRDLIGNYIGNRNHRGETGLAWRINEDDPLIRRVQVTRA